MNGKTLLFLFLGLMAEIMGTIGGFGSSLFFVPLAGFFYSFSAVLGITALLHVFSNLSKLLLFRHGFNRMLLLWMGIPAVIAVIIGGLLTALVPSVILESLLGVFLIALSLFFLLKSDLHVTPRPGNALTGGLISGFLAGLLGTGGAIRGLTMAAFALPKNTFIATSAAIDMGVDLSRSLIYFGQGYIPDEAWTILPGLVIISFVGSWLGKKIVQRLSEDRFRKLSLSLILLTGIATLTRTVWGLFS